MTARCLLIPAIVVAVFAVPDGPDSEAPLSTAFTYQGQLKQTGVPLNASADFEFSLWDADATPPGKQIGGTQTMPNVQVTDGLFTVRLDFGADAFNGEEARWLEVAVRSPTGGGAYTTLSPRQALTAAPFALQTRGITVDGQGNVGIGTTEPAYPLDVNGIIRTTGGIRFPNGSQQYTAASSPSIGPRGVREFADAGDHTWDAPPNVHRVVLELWGGSAGGGGGGGGSYAGRTGGGGGGGGAGAYLRTVVDVTPEQAYIIRIGSGGSGGSGGGVEAAGQDGEAGTASQFIEEPSLTVLATAAAGTGGRGGGGAGGSGGSGGAGGAGGGVTPLEGIVRPGSDGRDGTSGNTFGSGGHPGLTACGSVSPPYELSVYLWGAPTGGWGGYGGPGEQYGTPPKPGADGFAGHAGYAVLHW